MYVAVSENIVGLMLVNLTCIRSVIIIFIFIVMCMKISLRTKINFTEDINQLSEDVNTGFLSPVAGLISLWNTIVFKFPLASLYRLLGI